MTEPNDYPIVKDYDLEPLSSEVVASPESIEAAYHSLDQLIEHVTELDSDFVWSVTPSKGGGDTEGNKEQPHLRLLSMPNYTAPDGKELGEAFVTISWVDAVSGRQILVTEDQGSGQPWGDILNNAGAIVRKVSRTDTALLAPDMATVRKGKFTFGPARLEERQNAAQANNPFKVASESQIIRVLEIIETGTIYSHDGQGRLPAQNQRKDLKITDAISS